MVSPLIRTRVHALAARLLVAAMLLVSAGPLVHAADGHEDDWGAAFVQHDCSQHDHTLGGSERGVELPGADCAACQFGRHLRSLADDATSVYVPFATGDRIAHDAVRLPSAAEALPLPARAPPAFSL